jgi:RNA polymerase sigma-70 factor (ECF subfamily)
MVDKTTYLPEQAYEITEGHMLMQTIIDTLPEKKREVVRLMYEWELEPQDVADVLNIPAGTVRSRLHYARKQLTPLWKNLTKEWED